MYMYKVNADLDFVNWRDIAVKIFQLTAELLTMHDTCIVSYSFPVNCLKIKDIEFFTIVYIL